jgi:hypothetical protein
MDKTLDLPAMFDGLTPKEAQELSDRIAVAVIRAHEEFLAERMAEKSEEEAAAAQLYAEI